MNDILKETRSIPSYDELVKALRGPYDTRTDIYYMKQAADAIEELLKAARAMHLWIFLHSGNEKLAYKACGLSDEMNAFLGYSGSFTLTVPADEEE